MPRCQLEILARKYNTDKKIPDNRPTQYGREGLGYIKFYDKELKNRKIKDIIELGVGWGASIRMWSENFPHANIIGVDNVNRPDEYNELNSLKNIKIIIGDAGDRNFLQDKFENGRYDIIIDDASHKYNDTLAALLQLFPYLKNGGLYVIEDLHINYPMQRLLKNPNELPHKLKLLIKEFRWYCSDKLVFIEKI